MEPWRAWVVEQKHQLRDFDADGVGSSNNVGELVERKYEHGTVTDIDSETLPPGLNEEVIRGISARKNEPVIQIRSSGRAAAKIDFQACRASAATRISIPHRPETDDV